ncbi:hypothetical protein M413DRAFT_7808 [Hebeloma cylindrosporum]|uniref:Uncharacterized protein n=1 Tax=Hebeloma cylindrosporum TaxID=76867 RepID=A0A0C3CES5_HEBCY|nr:hypothetical protein M413DRAFT_7808 [Hebeloma cylindrosporum h7]
MAPHHQHSDSSEDEGSDAPEAVSLSQSKKHIQKLETSRKNAEIAQRQSKREKNRERDRKLKERAEKNKDEAAAVKSSAKGKGKVVESRNKDDELEARMERAMQEAQEESSEDEDEDEDKAESSSQYEEFEGISVNAQEDEDDNDSSVADEHADDDESQDDSEDVPVPEQPPKSQKTRFNPDHLPDELFAAAFASKPKRKTPAENSEKDDDPTKSRPTKKTKSSNVQKDVVIGSRAFRMLPNSTQPSTPATLPSRKVKQFLDRTLALKGGKQRTKGWERRPGEFIVGYCF